MDRAIPTSGARMGNDSCEYGTNSALGSPQTRHACGITSCPASTIVTCDMALSTGKQASPSRMHPARYDHASSIASLKTGPPREPAGAGIY